MDSNGVAAGDGAASQATVGLRFEADLSNSVLDDVRGEPGAMPLLQHALLELWKRRHGRWLRAGEYRAIGGVKQAIAETAEAVYRTCLPQDKDRDPGHLPASDPARYRAQPRRASGATRGNGSGWRICARRATTRRPNQGCWSIVWPTPARLLVTSVNPTTQSERSRGGARGIDPLLAPAARLVDEDRTTLLLCQDSVRGTHRDWERDQQNEDLLLHRGARLEAAEALRTSTRFPLNELEKAYVDACAGLRQKQAEERRTATAAEADHFQMGGGGRGDVALGGVRVLDLGLVLSRGTAEHRQDRTRATEGTEAEKQRDRAEWQLYASQINLAQTEWQYGTPSVAWHHLDACRWDLRGWEHDYLFTLFNKNQRTFYGHTGVGP